MIGDIGTDQHVARMRAGFFQRVFRGGVSHFIDIDHAMTRRPDQPTHNSRANEAAAARDQNSHQSLTHSHTSRGNMTAAPESGKREDVAFSKNFTIIGTV